MNWGRQREPVTRCRTWRLGRRASQGSRVRFRSTAFHIAVLSLAVAAAVACSSGASGPPFDGALAIGTWGGENAGMIVGDTAMHLHIGCSYGDVSGRVPITADGRFDVTGRYMLRAYPIAVGPAVPARFTGRLDGANATVTVTVDDTVQHTTVVLGPAVVTLGREPKLGPCPICRRPIVTR